jgi:hypothetical protein
VGGLWASTRTGAILVASTATFSTASTEWAIGSVSAFDGVFATGKALLLSLMVATLAMLCKAAASHTVRELIVGFSASTAVM